MLSPPAAPAGGTGRRCAELCQRFPLLCRTGLCYAREGNVNRTGPVPMKAFALDRNRAEFRNTPATNETLSAAEACAFLAVHRNTLYKLISEGEIPAFRLTTGGRWKFRRTDLEDWLADRKARSVR